MGLVDFHFTSAFALAHSILKWLSLGMLVLLSRFWQHPRFALPLGLGVVMAGIGGLFRVTHWAFATELLLLGAPLVALSYGLWFRTKKNFALLDYLKLGWVLGAAATVVAIVGFRALMKPVAGLTEALFWAMALQFIYQRWIRRPGPQPE